jgi:hypothetical protein
LAKLPWQEYLRRAFYNPYNYGLMILFGGLTIIDQNIGWFAIGVALEAAYLYTLTTNPRFQRVVESELEDQVLVNVDRMREQLWDYVDPSLRKRYQDVEALAKRLHGDMKNFAQLKDPLVKENVRKVATLMTSFLKLCVAITRYRNYLGDVKPGDLERDITRLEEEALGADERVAAVKAKNVDVLRKRLDKITKARANVEYLSAQLETIEDTMRLVVDQAVTLTDPRGTGTQIDSLLHTLNDAELIAAEMESFEELEAGLLDKYDPLPRSKVRN